MLTSSLWIDKVNGMKKPAKTDREKDHEAYQRLLKRYTKMALADMLGITKQAVTRWDSVPLRYVRRISEATGITKKRLRPSDFS